MRFLYTLSIQAYTIVIHCIAPFNTKAKFWVEGRKDIFKKIKKDHINQQNKKNTVWVHCASLGEFEQARILIEQLKNKKTDIRIVLTFFSPSGYEIRKDYEYADAVYYLPSDTPKNASKFISIIKPSSVFFIKYEFWFNYLNELRKQNISTYLVSGIFRENHYFFKQHGKWFRSHLDCFTHFYLQNKESEKLLQRIGYTNTLTVGDTRFDRVLEISNKAKRLPIIELFRREKKLFIAGSTWPTDEKLISKLNLSDKGFYLIIAPHEIDNININDIQKLFTNGENNSCLLYSQANKNNIASANILIIDNIGLLSSLYRYGNISYIGGGFGKGIHNTLEAATFGLPVIFGPNYKKFIEAMELIQQGGGFSISNLHELNTIFNLLTDNEREYTASSRIAKKYVLQKAGATQAILTSIWPNN